MQEQYLSTRCKGRVVVKGYVQIPGVDFTDSFAPVATDSAMRTIFAITLYHGHNKPEECWICEVIDVEAAFLEADMDENIYIEWPEGVKDVNDAVIKLGRLATLWLIIDAKQSYALKIQLRAKQFFKGY
jgi:hypothetical protein